ncbi:hypothetical protein DPQ33_08750 [Oceanidesulfovibrio indonesiensis]|uniref:Uncharacterized protein n=1 Tax=Oceanidesulfovibrio indonesiensis TaxID=54767 RepID=A0A7M3MG29_9BACT|nr:hypothetical protein DPQ33_08750 [Oceanidesulfovibrio indonesiensis]
MLTAISQGVRTLIARPMWLSGLDHMTCSDQVHRAGWARFCADQLDSPSAVEVSARIQRWLRL